MTLSETQKLSTGPAFPVFGMSSPGDETHCSAMWWDSMTTRIITGRSSKNRLPFWSWLAATARTPAPFMDPADRRSYHHHRRAIAAGPFLQPRSPHLRAEWSKARRRGHSGLTQRTSAVYAISWWWFPIKLKLTAELRQGLSSTHRLKSAASSKLSLTPEQDQSVV